MADEARPHIHVSFFVDAVEDKRKSAEEGRPIFKDEEFVKIKFVGDPKSELVAPAHLKNVPNPGGHPISYAEKYPKHYEMYKEGLTYHGEGTPLSELPFISNSKRKELEALNIHTAENLAALDGANLQKLGMGGRDLKNKAQAFLDSATGVAAISGLQKENEELKRQMAELKAMVSGQAGQMPPQDYPVENQLLAGQPMPGDDAAFRESSDSPFAAWEKEDLINWIVDNGGEKPHHATGLKKLVSIADDLNTKLRKEQMAAA